MLDSVLGNYGVSGLSFFWAMMYNYNILIV